MKIFYIARDSGLENTGASMVVRRNLSGLKELVGSDNVVEYRLPEVNLKNVVCSLIRCGSYGITAKEERKIIDAVRQVSPDFIFIESSSYGSLVKKMSKLGHRTMCFAHNLDTKLYKQEISSRNPLFSIPKYFLTWINEKKTTKYSDTIICLNVRDSNDFGKMFGRYADMILPITFPMRNVCNEDSRNYATVKPYYLFVGSDFFPNVEGIKSFVNNVAGHVDVDIHVVGGCCNNPVLKKLSLPENVSFLGYVDDLDREYYGASGVIAPIFKGSGMKTKTIEAMSYGKSIFGTNEAFAGIECDYTKIGGLCNTADEFIECINKSNKGVFNDYTYRLFKDEYSDIKFLNMLRTFILHKE